MQASLKIKLLISHIEIRTWDSQLPLAHADPLTISDLLKFEFFKCIEYIFAKKTSKLENFVFLPKRS